MGNGKSICLHLRLFIGHGWDFMVLKRKEGGHVMCAKHMHQRAWRKIERTMYRRGAAEKKMQYLNKDFCYRGYNCAARTSSVRVASLGRRRQPTMIQLLHTFCKKIRNRTGQRSRLAVAPLLHALPHVLRRVHELVQLPELLRRHLRERRTQHDAQLSHARA